MVKSERTIVSREISGTTDSASTKLIIGKITSIKIYAEVGFNIKAITENCPVPEYILGGAAAVIAIAAGYTTLYPRIIGNDNVTGAAIPAADNLYQQMAIAGTILFSVSGATTGKDWYVEVIYEN